MQNLAGDRAYEVFGVFHKLLEISASEKGGRRGVLRTHKGEPATVEDLAFDLRTTVEQVEFTISILTEPDVSWLQVMEEDLGSPGNSRKLPENPGKTRNNAKDTDDSKTPGKSGKNGEIPGKSGKNPGSEKEVSQVPRTQGLEVLPKKHGADKKEIPGNSRKLPEKAGIPQRSNRSRKESKIVNEVIGENENEDADAEKKKQGTASAPSSSTSIRLDCSSRLRFANDLRKILAPKNKSDLTALWNLQSWAGRLSNWQDVHSQLLELAKDSQRGRNPMAVFFSRVDEALGYRASVEADKRKQ